MQFKFICILVLAFGKCWLLLFSGAMLLVLNTQFMLVQAHQHYKLFSNSTNLWIIDSCLLLVVGHSLAVVPFVLDTERLCALIGTHKPIQPSGMKVKLMVFYWTALLHPSIYRTITSLVLFDPVLLSLS